MRKLIFATIYALGLFIYGCKSTEVGNPKDVLSAFFEALSKNDIDAAKKLATLESRAMLNLIKMGIGSKKNQDSEESYIEKYYGKANIEIGEPKIDGDVAIVPIKEVKGGALINFRLKRENGLWKVAFDKSSLMNMAMEKMREKGINPMDGIGKENVDVPSNEEVEKAMDKLKNVNMDSLKREMEKSINESNQ